VRVQSVAATDALLRRQAMPMRQIGAALVVPFPSDVGSAHGCSSRMVAICPGARERGPLWNRQGRRRERQSDLEVKPWQDQLFETLKSADIRQSAMCRMPPRAADRALQGDPGIRDIALTTEEEVLRSPLVPGSAASARRC